MLPRMIDESQKALPLQEQRRLGYVGILQEALEERDFEGPFHQSGLTNPPDCLTKVKQVRGA